VFTAPIQNDVGHGGTFLFPEGHPLIAGAHHLGAEEITAQPFQGSVPMGDDMILVKTNVGMVLP
jgi:hypothetical protein